MNFRKLAAVAALAVFALAACGGTAAPPTGTTAPPSSPAGAATTAPAATTAASTPPAVATTAPAGSAGTIDLCGLLSAADVQAVIAGSWLEGQLTSTGGYCHWDNTLSERVITAIDPATLEGIKASMPGGENFVILLFAASGYSFRDEGAHVQTTWLDIGEQLLIVEIPMSSDADADLSNAKELSEIVLGNL